MAEAKPKKKNAKPPTPAQLRARKKFIKMVKERAKAAKAAKRAADIRSKPKKRTVSTKGAKRSIAAKTKPRRNPEHRDAQHPIHVRQYWQGRKGYKTPWQRAHAAGQKQLFAMNPARELEKKTVAQLRRIAARSKDYANFKRWMPKATKAQLVRFIVEAKLVLSKKSNPTTLTKAKKLREEFLGAPTEKVTTMHAPKRSGARPGEALALMGRLKGVKIKGRGKLNFNGTNAILARSGKNKMYVLGKSYKLDHLKGTKRNPDGFIDLGEITTIEYEATKSHLGDSRPVTYFHHMGEEGGAKPHAIVNDEGLLLIEGGEYDINERGIIN